MELQRKIWTSSAFLKESDLSRQLSLRSSFLHFFVSISGFLTIAIFLKEVGARSLEKKNSICPNIYSTFSPSPATQPVWDQVGFQPVCPHRLGSYRVYRWNYRSRLSDGGQDVCLEVRGQWILHLGVLPDRIQVVSDFLIFRPAHSSQFPESDITPGDGLAQI